MNVWFTPLVVIVGCLIWMPASNQHPGRRILLWLLIMASVYVLCYAFLLCR